MSSAPSTVLKQVKFRVEQLARMIESYEKGVGDLEVELESSAARLAALRSEHAEAVEWLADQG